VRSERWLQVTEIFHAALASDPARREAFLADACGGDAALRAEVEALVAAHEEAGPFGETPLFGPAFSLEPGSSIGSYRIEELIGAGGMGEVYRARDGTLERDVAIKVLPHHFATDSDRVARLLREARLLAALNHPHIAAIYGVIEADTAHRGLVLEFVEGPTLAERLRSGGMPLPEALSIARQIADALDAAHGKGIIHRDLKPANIKAAPGGIVKVLDFGLAKIDAGGGGRSADLSHSPTVTVGSTRAGVIVGTAAYMSPEQARGKPLDKRTDIWSFGCVLYEMLAGRMAFPGETVADSIALVVSREPDWAAVPETTPLAVRRILQRCLERDPQQRLRDIGDVKHELDQALVDLRPPTPAGRAVAAPTRQPRAAKRGLFAAAGLALIVLAIVAAALFVLRQTTPPPASAEPPLQLTDFNDSAIHPAVSPDGRMVTFVRGGFFGSSAGGQTVQVYVKILPTGEPVQLTRDPSQKEQPIFSPDGSRIIYAAVMPGFKWDSWQVSVLGGAPRPFLPNASGLVWLDDQRLLYSEIMGGGVHMGIVTSTESRTGSRPIYFPRFEGGMAHRSAPSPDRREVLVVEMNGDWLPCRLVPFDGSSAGHRIGPVDGQCTTAAWSNDGRWMYFSSNAGGAWHVWRQRYPNGTPEQITFGPTEQEGTALTPDGKYVITSMGLQQASISLKDSSGERQLTSEGYAMLPTMLASGDRMFYLMRTGSRGYASGELWSLNVGTGEKERALPGRVMANYSISADGRRVVFTSGGSASDDGIWVADLDRRTPPQQLTRGGEFRAFFGGPGEIVYISPQAERRYLYRMREDGSGVEQMHPEPVSSLLAVSPDGHWAVVPETRTDGELRLRFVSLRGEEPMTVCENCVNFGYGPNRVIGSPIIWSMDGNWVFVSLQNFGLGTTRTVVLPYQSGVPLAALWPKGLRSEQDVIANPGATVINEANVFPAASASAHLSWRRTTQSNLYRVRLPD
jgi:eukaryotic-like serine/threonine-protein kinase